MPCHTNTKRPRILSGDVRPDDYLPVTPEVESRVARDLAFAADYIRKKHEAGRIPAAYDLDLNARFRRMSEHPFSLAVVFSDAHPPNVPPLIGLHNLLNYWQYTFNGSLKGIAIMGYMRFETL